MTGVTGAAKVFFLNSGLDPWQVLVIMVAIWFVLGCLIDSISIILLTVPIFAPIAMHLGFDPLAFAIMGILAIETGLLTPPFGILVFTVKAAVPDRDVELAEIFRGSIPYWIVLLSVVAALAAFPQLATCQACSPGVGKKVAAACRFRRPPFVTMSRQGRHQLTVPTARLRTRKENPFDS